MVDILGENIWDVSSWSKDISWKSDAIKEHLDNLEFNECISQVMSLANTYFASVFHKYEDEVEGSEIEFNYLDVLVFITEEFVFGHYFHGVTPLQELQMMETFCSYFQTNPLDSIRFFVFDCLFGIPSENLEIQKGFVEQKMNVICKLASMAVGTRCENVLNCVAVWMHTYGAVEKRAMIVACSILTDYCLICPQAVSALKDVIDVSPVFAYQFTISITDYYYDVLISGCKADKLPPSLLVDIIATWIIEMPRFCTISIPPLFLQLPSIHKYQRVEEDNTSPFFLCPALKLVRLCIVQPFVHNKLDHVNSEEFSKVHIDANSVKAEQVKKYKHCYSRLIYGLLNYISLQKKFEPPPPENADDLEPGELLEETEKLDLLSAADVMSYVVSFQRMLETANEPSSACIEESIDSFLQIVQLANYARCIPVPPKKLLSILELVPKTPLSEHVLANLNSKAARVTAKAKKT